MPKIVNFSSVNANFENLNVKNFTITGYTIPYSLNVASTESLPEEGEMFSTMTFIPFDMQIVSVSLQANQEIICDSKVKVSIGEITTIFTVSRDKPIAFQTINTPVLFEKNTLQNITIENLKDDDGDVTSCSVTIHCKCKM